MLLDYRAAAAPITGESAVIFGADPESLEHVAHDLLCRATVLAKNCHRLINHLLRDIEGRAETDRAFAGLEHEDTGVEELAPEIIACLPIRHIEGDEQAAASHRRDQVARALQFEQLVEKIAADVGRVLNEVFTLDDS